MTTLGTMAQGVTYDKNRFLDNWSVGINAGGTTTLHTGYNYWENMAPYFGVQFGKEFTPSLGMTIEGNFAVNPLGARPPLTIITLPCWAA